MKVYLSGPMTGMPEHNRPLFHAEAARLRALGYEVSNPAENIKNKGQPWHICLRYDLVELMGCDMLALLPLWQISEGANLEVHVAHRVKIEIQMAADLTFPCPVR